MSDETTAGTPTGGSPRPARGPNYAARRMLVTTVAITAIVAFGVVGWTVVRGDGDSSGGSGGDWNEIALVNPTSGAVTVVDRDGETVRTAVGRGRVTEVHTIDRRLALVGPTQIVLDGGDDTTTIPISRTDTVTPIHTPGRLHLLVGAPTGGNVRVVDVGSGEVLDIAAMAKAAEDGLFDEPLLFAETVRWSSDATAFAVADAASFQTIVVREGSTDVSFYRAQPVAVADERVATSQIIGGQAEVEVFDTDRESKARVPSPIPAGGLMIDDDLLMVTIDGGVYRVREGEAEAERLARVAVPSGATVAEVRPILDGDRLVVIGNVFQAVIDLEGRTVFTTTFTTPLDVDVPRPQWTCLPVGGDGTFHSVVTLDEGEQVADLSGLDVTGVSDDGCSVIGDRGGVTEVVAGDGSVSLGRVRSATLGPDGRTVVRSTAARTTELLRIDDDFELGDPVDLSDVAPANALVAFLP